MNTPDFGRALLLAQLSSIIYKVDPIQIGAAVSELDCVLVGLVECPGFQAMVVTNPVIGQIIVFRGTPVTCARDIVDWCKAVGCDINFGKTTVAGFKVLTAPYYLVRKKWPDLLALIDPTKPLTMTGHSLGAVMALIAVAMMDRLVKISAVVFAPFQAADAGFWKAIFGGREPPLIFGRRADFAPGWDHLDPDTCHAAEICHLLASCVEWLTSWPWYDESVPDHDVDLYVNDLTPLAANQKLDKLAAALAAA